MMTIADTQPAPIEDRMTFPPFPTPPPGVTIVPFKDFKERGIRMFPYSSKTGKREKRGGTEQDEDPDDQDIERDNLGIPTIELRSRHGTDQCKTQTKRKRKAREKKPASAPGARKDWWDVWEDSEDLRVGFYNPNASIIDRIHEAANDFKRGRSWPPGSTGLSYLWDQFRLFAGLLSNTPVWTRTDKAAGNGEDDGDDEEEDDEEELAAESADIASSNGPSEIHVAVTKPDNGGGGQRPHRRKPRPPYATYGTDPIPVGSEEAVKELLNEESLRKEEKLITFLNDPELTIRVFLTSYMRDQGLIWSDRYLINMPRLLGFFVRFVLRNRAFPEPTHERAFKRCLALIEQAEKELILTSKVAKEIPDAFSQACRECFGKKADGYWNADAQLDLDGGKKADDKNVDKDEAARAKKKAKIDSDEVPPAEQQEPEATEVEMVDAKRDAFPSEMDDHDPPREQNASPDVHDVDSAMHVDQPATNSTKNDVDDSGGWGNSGWGADWGSSVDAMPVPPKPLAESDDPWASADASAWLPSIPSLLSTLGPTAFPNTHTTGLVEWSMRRVKSSHAPPPANTLPKTPVTQGKEPEENPDAVQLELERRYAKVVLELWIGWDGESVKEEAAHLSLPRILKSSRGAVVPLPEGPSKESVEGASASLKPHDPMKDEITVLVEPGVLEYLHVGMGLGATWVQLAHAQDIDGADKAKRKKKKKSKKAPERFWYVDELLLTLPSFYTPAPRT